MGVCAQYPIELGPSIIYMPGRDQAGGQDDGRLEQEQIQSFAKAARNSEAAFFVPGGRS